MKTLFIEIELLEYEYFDKILVLSIINLHQLNIYFIT